MKRTTTMHGSEDPETEPFFEVIGQGQTPKTNLFDAIYHNIHQYHISPFMLTCDQQCVDCPIGTNHWKAVRFMLGLYPQNDPIVSEI